MGELAEAALSLFLLVCWIAGLPIIMAPTRFLAVAPSNNGLNYVLNANLYFFSWAAFLCIVFISFSLVVETISGAQEAVSSVTPKLLKWYMLVITSLVVMASAAQFQQSQNCTNVQSITCSSNKFAISLGVIGFVAASLVVAVMSYVGTLSIYIETGVALFLFIMYTAGVGVITFDYGSGVTIGNLYFSTWAGFIITIFLLVECYQGVTEAQTIHGNGTENGAKHSTNGGDIAVESIEEEDDYI
jgi:hypothetical protein